MTVPRVVSEAGATVVSYARRGPLTTTFLVVLLGTRVALTAAADPAPVLAWISTNVQNLGDHPLGALAGSLVVVNGTLTDVASRSFGGTVITLGLGIGGGLWWLEVHRGRARAATVLIAGHVGGTLVAAVVILAALRSGRYPPEVRTASDYGISYGAEAVLGALTWALPRVGRIPWVAFVLAWPLAGADWFGVVPDFTTIGHLTAAALGLALGLGVRGTPGPRPP